MSRIHIAFVWHMHQPWYLWPASNRAALPFARLHASGAYYDMPWLLRDFDDTRVTFNLVPSLVEQIQGYAEGEIVDRAAELSRRDPSDLTLDDQRYLLTHMCGGHPGAAMAASTRYGELSHKRGVDRKPETIDRACRVFTPDEYLDLQVLFNLAWCGFALENTSDVVRELRAKDRNFTNDEKHALLAEMDGAVERVIEICASAAAEGKAELICSPHYHPILPLLANMDDAEARIPGSQLPERRWREPEEARRQLREGLERHAETFGRPPRGIWPSEGSVSDEALRIVAEEGVGWAATDEEVLAASLSGGGRPAPSDLYRPWLTADGRVSLVFRDHRLSDLIGFVYRDWDPADAAKDFIGRLKKAGADAGDGDQPPLISVILDGENRGAGTKMRVRASSAASTRASRGTTHCARSRSPSTSSSSRPRRNCRRSSLAHGSTTLSERGSAGMSTAGPGSCSRTRWRPRSGMRMTGMTRPSGGPVAT